MLIPDVVWVPGTVLLGHQKPLGLRGWDGDKPCGRSVRERGSGAGREAVAVAKQSVLEILIVDDDIDIPLALGAMIKELAEVNISVIVDGLETADRTWSPSVLLTPLDHPRSPKYSPRPTL